MDPVRMMFLPVNITCHLDHSRPVAVRRGREPRALSACLKGCSDHYCDGEVEYRIFSPTQGIQAFPQTEVTSRLLCLQLLVSFPHRVLSKLGVLHS